MVSSDSEKLKIGIIGTNFISDRLASAAAESQSTCIHSVYSRTEERGRAFCTSHGIGTLYTNFELFLNSDIDAVYVASPNMAHCAQTLEALAHGKHVLCEKPISSNLSEYRQMRMAAESRGLVLLEAMRPAFDPALSAIKAGLELIGIPRRAALEFCQYSSRYDKFKAGEVMRTFCPEYSNAAVMDIGVYPLFLCLRLFGYPTGDIRSSSVFLENGFEGAGEIILPYGGMNAVISYSKISDSVNPSVISGENGSLIIDKISAPTKIVFKSRGGEEKPIPFEYRENNMVFELEEFARLVRSREICHIHADFSELEMKLLDEVRKNVGIVFPADK